MSHTIVTYSTKPGQEEANAALVRAVFAELERSRPEGFRYAAFKATDTGQFIHLYTDEGAAPGTLQQLASFQAFVSGAEDRHEQAASFTQFELIGAYRTFGEPTG